VLALRFRSEATHASAGPEDDSDDRGGIRKEEGAVRNETRGWRGTVLQRIDSWGKGLLGRCFSAVLVKTCMQQHEWRGIRRMLDPFLPGYSPLGPTFPPTPPASRGIVNAPDDFGQWFRMR
jgi:hypothetical protein